MCVRVCVLWGQVDLDGNGFINFAEFVTMMRKCKVDTDFDRQIREAFKVRCGPGAVGMQVRLYVSLVGGRCPSCPVFCVIFSGEGELLASRAWFWTVPLSDGAP